MRHAQLVRLLAFAPFFPPAARAAALEMTVTLGVGRPEGDLHEVIEFENDSSPALAASFGAALTDRVALHGRVDLATLAPKDRPDEYSGTLALVGFAPVFHLLGRRHAVADLQLTPIVGGFFLRESFESYDGEDVTLNARGWQYGGAAAALFRAGAGMTIGPSFRWAKLRPNEVCVELDDDLDCDSSEVETFTYSEVSFAMGFSF